MLTKTLNAMQSQGKYKREIWGEFGKHRGGEWRTYKKKKKRGNPVTKYYHGYVKGFCGGCLINSIYRLGGRWVATEGRE